MYFKINTVNGQYYWLLYKNNGDSIAQAPNIYSNLASARADIELIRQWAGTSTVVLPVGFAEEVVMPVVEPVVEAVALVKSKARTKKKG